MRGDSNGLSWLESRHGDRIGVQVVERDGLRVVRFVFPGGVEKVVSAADAPRILTMLNDGMTFAEITGTETIRLSPDDL